MELAPHTRVIQAITFDSPDPAFSGEMTMVVTFEPVTTAAPSKEGRTRVSILFENIPAGIRPEDNEAGTRLTLDKLARYVEQQSGR